MAMANLTLQEIALFIQQNLTREFTLDNLLTMTSPTPSVDTNPSSASLSDAESDALSRTCHACCKPYRSPRLLSCFHTFCLQCLEKMVRGGDMIVCPRCNCKTPLPNGKAQDLRPDFVTMNETEAVERSTGSGACGLCGGLRDKQVTGHCVECACLLCASCHKSHDEMYQFQGHRIVAASEPGDYLVMCELHKTCCMEFFCCNAVCNVPRCRECIKLCSLQSHNYYPLSVISDSLLLKLYSLLQKAHSEQPKLSAAGDNISNSAANLNKQYEMAKEGINTAFFAYAQLLSECKDAMVQKLDATYNHQKATLTNAFTELEDVAKKAESLDRFIKRADRKIGRVQMLMLKQMIEERLLPVVNYVPTVNGPEAFKIEFRTNHQVVQSAIQNGFGAIDHNLSALAKHQMELQPTTRWSLPTNGNHPELEWIHQFGSMGLLSERVGRLPAGLSPLNMASPSLLHSLDNSSAPAVNGGDIFSNVSMFQPGLVNGSESRGNSITSSSPPGSLVMRHKMSFYARFGEYGSSHAQFSEPSGVAVNAEGDILVADTNNHRIEVFDRSGQLKFEFGENGKEKGQLLYPNRVAVCPVTGRIVITERSPTHQVQIFTSKGEFVLKFGSNMLQHPRGLTVDGKGRILVVECKVMRVSIFSGVGELREKFYCKDHLEFPNSIATNDSEEVFISDNRAHCVMVFTYKGEFLRKIGGSNITNYPIGVGINLRGEVVIADNHNNFNVTVFTQEGKLKYGFESKVKHAQCFDVALGEEGEIILASKDFRIYCYRYGAQNRQSLTYE